MIYFSLKFFVIQFFGIILYNFYMLTINSLSGQSDILRTQNIHVSILR